MTLDKIRRNPSMTAAQMRAAQMAISRSPEARQVLTEAMEGLQLAANVLDAFERVRGWNRGALEASHPELYRALVALEAGPPQTREVTR